jgi:hypothetical protein
MNKSIAGKRHNFGFEMNERKILSFCTFEQCDKVVAERKRKGIEVMI